MKVALTGLMQSGKSSLLSAITGKPAAAIGDTHITEAIVPVPDERIEWLDSIYNGKKKVYGTIDCLDLPGLSFADENTRTAARRIFGQVRTVDMFVIVSGAFSGDTDFAKALADLKTELLLSDLELVTTRIERLEKQIHKPTSTQKKDKAELALQLKLQAGLEEEKPVSGIIQNDDELALIRSLGFLTLKPMMVVVNVSEDDLAGPFDADKFGGKGVEVIKLCATLESELAQLDSDSREEFMADLGIIEPAVNKFVRSCYKTLGLISFLTIGKDEVRAWPIQKGTNALDAAGKVHSDIKRGFIRAETISYADFRKYGDEKAVKAAGKARLEGKSYIVADGDIINFRFNV